MMPPITPDAYITAYNRARFILYICMRSSSSQHTRRRRSHLVYLSGILEDLNPYMMPNSLMRVKIDQNIYIYMAFP